MPEHKDDKAAIDAALNAALAVLQRHMSVPDGGIASVFWTGRTEGAFDALMREYMEYERWNGNDRGKEGA